MRNLLRITAAVAAAPAIARPAAVVCGGVGALAATVLAAMDAPAIAAQLNRYDFALRNDYVKSPAGLAWMAMDSATTNVLFVWVVVCGIVAVVLALVSAAKQRRGAAGG